MCYGKGMITDARLDKHPDGERIAKLPRWAAYELLALRDEVARLTTAITEAGPADSDTFVDDFSGAARVVSRGLGRGAMVRFELAADTPSPDGRPRRNVGTVEARIISRYGRNLLSLRSAEALLTVLPDSGNTILIESVDR